MRRQISQASCLCAGLLLMEVSSAGAQGLIWNLPEEEGAWVRYEGTYRQFEERPEESAEARLEIEWRHRVEIKSLGREMAEFDGNSEQCRWIEIKAQTGKPSDVGLEGLDLGPVGVRIYKVLVPESRISDTRIDSQGRVVDSKQIPAYYIPIVKGYRKIGDQAVQPITSRVLQIYPSISLLKHYRTLELANSSEDVDLVLNQQQNVVSAKKYTGVHRREGPTTRSQNEGQLWRTDELPFGLAKWTVKVVREEKDNVAPRSAFQLVTEVNVEMAATQSGTGAQSDLAVPAAQ